MLVWRVCRKTRRRDPAVPLGGSAGGGGAHVVPSHPPDGMQDGGHVCARSCRRWVIMYKESSRGNNPALVVAKVCWRGDGHLRQCNVRAGGLHFRAFRCVALPGDRQPGTALMCRQWEGGAAPSDPDLTARTARCACIRPTHPTMHRLFSHKSLGDKSYAYNRSFF